MWVRLGYKEDEYVDTECFSKLTVLEEDEEDGGGWSVMGIEELWSTLEPPKYFKIQWFPSREDAHRWIGRLPS